MKKRFFEKCLIVLFSAASLFACSKTQEPTKSEEPFTLLKEGEIGYDYITEAETPHAVMTLNGEPFSFEGKIYVKDTKKELDSLVAGDRISLYQDKKTKEEFVRCEPAIIARGSVAPTPGSGKRVLVVYNGNVHVATNYYLEYGIAEDMTIRKTPYVFDNVYYLSCADYGYKDVLGNTLYRLMAMYEYKVSIKNRAYFD